jgi:AraC-like DNA-binding protein
MAEAPSIDIAVRPPAPALRPFIARYAGFRQTGEGLAEAVSSAFHRGLPSRHVTVMISLGAPIDIAAMPSTRQSPGKFQAFIGGLHDTPALVRRNDRFHGLHLFLTPLGIRALLGLPASALASTIVDLAEVLGGGTDGLFDRLIGANSLSSALDVLDDAFLARLDRDFVPSPELGFAWDRIMASDGAIGIEDLAEDIGWSRRHLSERFRNDLGLAPKTAARIARFERACGHLRNACLPLAQVAADCGYFDQAHMSREWTAIAGCPPKTWIREELPFIQDYELASWED